MRKNFLWGFIGHNTTGKTPTAIELVKAWRQSRPGFKSIVFDPQGKFQDAGVVDITIPQNLHDWAHILCEKNKDGTFKYRNSILILDDYRMLHHRDQIDAGFLDLLALRVKMNMDIIYITHSPKLILERLSYYTTDYSIFYTESQLGSFQSRIPKYVVCQKAAILVNKYVMKYGRGTYPNFPHIHIKAESDDLELINLEPTKVQLIMKEDGQDIKLTKTQPKVEQKTQTK